MAGRACTRARRYCRDLVLVKNFFAPRPRDTAFRRSWTRSSTSAVASAGEVSIEDAASGITIGTGGSSGVKARSSRSVWRSVRYSRNGSICR